jgi:DNA-binding NarL/FixJ family response regulator
MFGAARLALDSGLMALIEAMPISVAIVEDDAPLRSSLTGILQRAPNCSCVGAFASAEEALREIPALSPQVVLMDINLPGMDGVQCVRQLAEVLPGAQILMLTVHEDTDTIFESLSAGAAGYLLKPVRAAELLAAVKDVSAGGAPMTSNIARKVVQSFKRAGTDPDDGRQLSPRERDVLDYLVKGYSYKEVAEQMGISYSTVHTHIEHIYHKLHVQSRAQAVAKYLRV